MLKCYIPLDIQDDIMKQPIQKKLTFETSNFFLSFFLKLFSVQCNQLSMSYLEQLPRFLTSLASK